MIMDWNYGRNCKGFVQNWREKEFNLSENQSCFVPIGAKHRLSNPSNEKLVIIEVQSGEYLGEDDIFRFEDRYGRKTK